MSINVTVKGNPVSIRRGKMVTTTDPDCARKEFQKRRFMRLEQVRQQSKEIAQDVRDKVRKEKAKQLSNVEKEGEARLKEWQNRKLLQLQNQYDECLKDIGLGHSLATVTEDAEEEAAVNSKLNRQVAKERGQKAAAMLQIEKNDHNMRKAIPQQQKKIAQEIEKTRSAMVANINKNKKKSRKKKNKSARESVNITIETSASDAEIPALNLNSEIDDNVENERSRSPLRDSYKSPTPTRCPSTCSSPRQLVPTVPCTPILPRQEFSYDDRISNHIKQRRWRGRHDNNAMSEENFLGCDICTHHPHCKSQIIHQACPCDGRQVNAKTQTGLSTTSRVNFHTDNSVDNPIQTTSELPYKPTVSLKDAKSSEKISSSRVEKVTYYDHSNRYTKTCRPEDNVEKIQPESIEICPNRDEMEHYMSKVHKRDRDAAIRGKIAVEKEKITRDYEEMMRKLPLLQRQERIASIKKDDPILHMSQERHKERLAAKQLKLENHFRSPTNLPKPTIITIPPLPGTNKKCDCDDPKDKPEPVMATWDVTSKKKPHATSANSNLASLQLMLDKLKEQRAKVLMEIGSLPETSRLYKLIKELEGKKKDADCDCEEDRREKKRRKTRRKSSRSREKIASSRIESSSTSLPSDKGKKPKRKVRERQSTETQTTPRATPTSNKQKLDKSTAIEPIDQDLCCPCKEITPRDAEAAKEMEKICEIVIKIKEDKVPEILVSPKKKDITVKTDTVVFDNRKPRNVRGALEKTVDNTSSTSYLSLPESVAPRQRIGVKKRQQASTLQVGKEPSRPSPPTRKRKLDPRLIVYIRKLLSMSNRSIDELGVSTTSDASTPSTSILNNYINNPMEQLNTLMHFYQLSPEDVADAVRDTNMNENAETNATESTIRFSIADQSNPEFRTSSKTSLHDYSIEHYPDIMAKYAEIADSCHQRISNLSALIEKVRQEKQEILRNPNSSASDKDNSTAYLNLPSHLSPPPRAPPPQQKENETAADSGSLNSTKRSNLSDTDEIMRRILEIDYSLAERLKAMSARELNTLYDDLKLSSTSADERDCANKTDEIAHRMQSLLSKEMANERQKKQINVDLPDFVPMLLDIKELPKLPHVAPTNTNSKVQATSSSYNIELIKSTKRPPPPTKAFLAVQRTNGDVGVPHQLSTIIEADSQMSTRQQDKRPASPSQTSEKGTNPKEETVKTRTLTAVPPLLGHSSETSVEDDKSELDHMEGILKSMGMGWAVTTLRKTQEALAHGSSSSSSSLDINISQKEVMITEKQQTIHHVSSIDNSSSVDVARFMKEIGELSMLSRTCTSTSSTSGAEALSTTRNQQQQRTSTPILSTKSSEKSKTKSSAIKFTEESDISSVKSNANRSHGTDVQFISLISGSKDSNNITDGD